MDSHKEAAHDLTHLKAWRMDSYFSMDQSEVFSPDLRDSSRRSFLRNISTAMAGGERSSEEGRDE